MLAEPLIVRPVLPATMLTGREMQTDQNETAGRLSPDFDQLAEQATRCRRLARGIEDRAAAEILERMAAAYDAEARALRA